MNKFFGFRAVVVSFCLCMWCYTYGQTSFSVSATSINMQNRGHDEFVFYAYTDLANEDTTDLHLRWVITHFDIPGQWESYVEDPDSIYTVYKDSADFVLPVVQPFPDKLIVRFHPNNHVGRATVKLHIFRVDDPTDSVTVTWQANTVILTTSIDEIPEDPGPLYPNPTKGTIYFPEHTTHFALYSVDGAMILSGGGGAQAADLSRVTAGMYFVKLKNAAGETSTSRVLLQP